LEIKNGLKQFEVLVLGWEFLTREMETGSSSSWTNLCSFACS
jgi:hypothetical protein